MMQKNQVSPIRIVVLGAPKVGKSAVTVRYLTQRFIGEYSSEKDLLYCSQVQLDNNPHDLQILDTSRDQEDVFPAEKMSWGDAFVVVYSIADRSSFLVALECLQEIRQQGSLQQTPVLLIGNKRDLEHIRQVQMSEGQEASVQFNVQFYEVSAAESHRTVTGAFQSVLRETRGLKMTSVKRKISVMTVSKIISAVFGKNSVNDKKRPSVSL